MPRARDCSVAAREDRHLRNGPELGTNHIGGGRVRRKNLFSTVVQCFTIFSVACAVWTLWGYSLAFAPTHGGLIGGLFETESGGERFVVVIGELEGVAFACGALGVDVKQLCGGVAHLLHGAALGLVPGAGSEFVQRCRLG